MTIKELILEYMNNCYIVTHSNLGKHIILYVYDEQIIRQKKLNRILKKDDFIFDVKNGEIIFIQNYKKKSLIIDNEIWRDIQSKRTKFNYYLNRIDQEDLSKYKYNTGFKLKINKTLYINDILKNNIIQITKPNV